MIHPSQSQHWYCPRTCQPVYEVPNAKGDKMVKTTLAHARKMNLVPGITTILNCAAKPALENWKVRQGILAALTLPRNDGETDDQYLDRVLQDSREQAAQARDRGTEVHALLEGYYQGEIDDARLLSLPEEDRQTLQGVTEMIDVTCGKQEWEAERVLVHSCGYGSKADLVSPEWLIDFKGSDFDESKALHMKVWPEHWMQLAATDQGLEGARYRRCCILYFSRSHPGVVQMVEVTKEQLARGWGMFQSLLEYWQIKNNYYPDTGEQT